MRIEAFQFEWTALKRVGGRFKLAFVTGRRIAAGTAMLASVAVLAGCQSISGTPSLSQVRIIDASPDAPGLDAYQGDAALAYNLGFGMVTSYVPISPGNYPIAVDAARTRQQLASTSATFLANGQYTVLVENYAASLQELIVKDQSQPAPGGDVSLRFIDESVQNGAVDVYLVPSGATLAGSKPVASGITFNTETAYLNLPAGTYTLEALPAGAIPTAKSATLFTGAAVAYPGGSARTIVLIDTGATPGPGLRVVTAKDYDLPDEGS